MPKQARTATKAPSTMAMAPSATLRKVVEDTRPFLRTIQPMQATMATVRSSKAPGWSTGIAAAASAPADNNVPASLVDQLAQVERARACGVCVSSPLPLMPSLAMVKICDLPDRVDMNARCLPFAANDGLSFVPSPNVK